MSSGHQVTNITSSNMRLAKDIMKVSQHNSFLSLMSSDHQVTNIRSLKPGFTMGIMKVSLHESFFITNVVVSSTKVRYFWTITWYGFALAFCKKILWQTDPNYQGAAMQTTSPFVLTNTTSRHTRHTSDIMKTSTNQCSLSIMLLYHPLTSNAEKLPDCSW